MGRTKFWRFREAEIEIELKNCKKKKSKEWKGSMEGGGAVEGWDFADECLDGGRGFD